MVPWSKAVVLLSLNRIHLYVTSARKKSTVVGKSLTTFCTIERMSSDEGAKTLLDEQDLKDDLWVDKTVFTLVHLGFPMKVVTQTELLYMRENYPTSKILKAWHYVLR